MKKDIHLNKIYVENHRGRTDIPVSRLKAIKKMIEEEGILTAGGITLTQNINGIRKPAIYDTFCYTDPDHREECIRISKELASVFDEIILDDFFFTAYRCGMCIDAKGKRSWKEYRLSLMAEFAEELVKKTREVNPNLKYVVKYPNWYESYQECGFHPEVQRWIFDGIYTGTETRTPYDAQHLQRYESYSILRLMENIAPGRNGGGWIDLWGSLEEPLNLLEQAECTLLAGAKELTLWNFGMYSDWKYLPVLGAFLNDLDIRMEDKGNPKGTYVYEPFHGCGEDQLYNYLGMCGIDLEPVPDFPDHAPVILLTEASGEDDTSVERLKAYIRNGGNAVVTIGYFRRMSH